MQSHTRLIHLCMAALGASLTLLPGAVVAQQQEVLPNPITTPGATWAFDGFLIDAPDGEDWASLSKDNSSAELGKKFADNHTAAALVEARQVQGGIAREQELLDWLRATQTRGTRFQNMTVLDYQAEAFTPKGVLCGRFKSKVEDKRPQFAASAILLIRGLSCVRPDQPDTLVNLTYAERGAANTMTPEIEAVGEKFLGSLRFLPPIDQRIVQARNAIGNKKADEALGLLQPLAEQGDAEAALFLGAMYLYGTGVQTDYALARKWLEQAAKQGRRDALFNLGAMHDKGLGTPRDVQQAIKWFHLAADQRDAAAQLNLALLYLKGDGIPKDAKAGEEWLRRAAGNGSKRAQGILARGGFKE